MSRPSGDSSASGGISWFAIVKGWHAAEFAILFVFTLAVIDRLTRSRRRRNVALALTFPSLAVLDEYHQTFVPGRGGTWSDVAIDTLGATLAGLVAWRWRSTYSERRPESIGRPERVTRSGPSWRLMRLTFHRRGRYPHHANYGLNGIVYSLSKMISS